MLNEDSFHTGTLDTLLCDCGKVDESVEHFATLCELHWSLEGYAWYYWRSFRLQSTDAVWELLKIVYSYQRIMNDGIRKSDISSIKGALFDFISSCDRNI